MTLSPLSLERACLRAWPGAVSEARFGWVLQATEGRSLRANAVWPLDWTGDTPIEDAVRWCMDWCRRRRITPCFKLADGAMAPSELAIVLGLMGLSPGNETLVMTRALHASPEATPPAARLLDTPTESIWTPVRESAPSAEDYRERRGIVERIAAPHVFAQAQSGGRDAAIGLGVLTDDLLGLYLMRTAPWARRRGLAQAIVGALSAWGAAQGARYAYLQVEEHNAAAVALYAQAGFRLAYRYRYWR